MAGVPREKFVFIDEAGCNLAMAVLYGWAPIGKRARSARPVNRGKNISMIGAIDDCGMLALRAVEGATNKAKFVAFISEVLAPKLMVGQVVVMDNLRAHHAPEVREAIEAVGARVLYLPPYSPELNPIELCWSKFKRTLRRLGARTVESLRTAIRKARATITVDDAFAWFRHCGYA